MPATRMKWWGWGREGDQPPPETGATAREHLGFGPSEPELPARLEDVELPAPRIEPPGSLAAISSTDREDRASHSYGKAYRDIVRAFRGRIDNPVDVVVRPREESELEQILEWCADAGAAAIPYGGGTSVVGGLEPRGLDAAVSIDLGAFDRVLEVDQDSLAARVQAGVRGPRLGEQLREHGLTLRHYPQSWEFSTLGGWVATRAGGHYATGATHIDDLVESVRAITPAGAWESRRLPGSGAGPSPDRMLIGSEGILGVITEAWIRVQRPPGFRASASVQFGDFGDGARAVRALAQCGLQPSNCRLLDADEATITGAASGRSLLVLGFESADHPLGPWMDRAVELCRDHRGEVTDGPSLREPGEGSGGDTWRNVFLQAPYLRDTLIAAGVLVDTFETAITWDRFDGFVAAVRERAEAAVREVCGDGRVTCRLTHAYPDGAAPYFTVYAPARRGSEVEQWDAVKAAASEALIASGGTITHHHAVGRDHRPWYDQQRPEPFGAALRAAKRAVDPAGVLNPGVLIDP
jgi:alkyldihydroxyacetonephosphate synthase